MKLLSIENCYKILDWDTDFFGFKVARIIPQHLNNHNLQDVLHCLNNSDVKLVYYSVDTNDFDANENACKVSSPVNSTVLMELQMNANHEESLIYCDDNINSSCSASDITLLENLAVQCGGLSRFAVDQQFPHDKFVDLYKKWVAKAVLNNAADKLFYYRLKEKIVGFVSVKTTAEKVGIIDLMVVDRKYRKRGIGKDLISGALSWGYSVGLHKFTVATQGDNIAAQCLYEANGFSLVKTEENYHFWLLNLIK